MYVPFSVHTMLWFGEHRAFIVEEFIKNGGAPVAKIDLKAKIYEQRPVTLEALKETIRQEVAAITPEMILKVMDNYRERLHQFINIQGRHMSDGLFKTR